MCWAFKFLKNLILDQSYMTLGKWIDKKCEKSVNFETNWTVTLNSHNLDPRGPIDQDN